MSNIKFDNCNFSNCNMHIGDNNYNSGKGGVSDAMGLGVVLLGGALFLPTIVSTILPLCAIGAKSFLMGTSIYCGVKTVKTLLCSRSNDIKMLEVTDNNKLNSKGYIEIEPLSVRDAD